MEVEETALEVEVVELLDSYSVLLLVAVEEASEAGVMVVLEVELAV
jgi:hypothetical protein